MEPEITRTNPQAYYYYLRQQGLSIQDAARMLEQRFGPPKSKEQQAKEAAKDSQSAQLAQIGGAIGGLVIGRYVMNNAGKWIDSITGQEVAKETAKQLTDQASTMAQSGSVGLTRAVPDAVTSSVDGSGATVDLGGGDVPDLVTVETPVGPREVPVEVANDPGFLEGVNWGKVAQGAVGAAQVYQAYNAYKSGDELGAGIYGAAGAGNLAASGVAGASAASGASSALGGYLVPGANLAAGLYGGYQTAQYTSDAPSGGRRNTNSAVGGAASGAATGAAIGSVVPGVGTAIGAGVGALVGGLAGLTNSYFGSSKDKYQMLRDGARKSLQGAGILDENYQGTLADGSTFDFGKDGKTHGKLKEEALGDPAAFADAIASIEGLYGRPREAVATLYANAATSNAGGDYDTMLSNMRHFAQQRGFTMESAQQQLNKLKEENLISQNQYDVYLDKARILTGGYELPQEAQARPQVQRPGAGQVARVSPGKYMDDQGAVRDSLNVRKALVKAYGKTRNKRDMGL